MYGTEIEYYNIDGNLTKSLIRKAAENGMYQRYGYKNGKERERRV